MNNKQKTQDDPAQYKRFLESAREAEADDTEEGADKAFGKVVKDKRANKSKS